MSDDQELAQIRSTAESVLDRARNDEGFLASLRNDPVGALQAAGLSDGDAKQIGLDEWRYGDDAEGFQKCTWTCDRWSCKATICGNVPYSN